MRDKASVNPSSLRQLGCLLYVNNYGELDCSFLYPTKKYKVFIILDPCHMLKLTRNILDS